MKYTLNLDKDLVDRVIEATGAKTRTEAITIALKEIDRRTQLTAVLKRGLGATEDELKNMFDPASDPISLRAAETHEPYPNQDA